MRTRMRMWSTGRNGLRKKGRSRKPPKPLPLPLPLPKRVADKLCWRAPDSPTTSPAEEDGEPAATTTTTTSVPDRPCDQYHSVKDLPQTRLLDPSTHSPAACASAIFAMFLEEIYSKFPMPSKYCPRGMPHPPRTMEEFAEYVTSYVVTSSLACRPPGWTARFEMFLGPHNAAGGDAKWAQGWQSMTYWDPLTHYRWWYACSDNPARLEKFEARLRKLFNELEVLPRSSGKYKLWATKRPKADCTTARGTGVCVVRNDGDPPRKGKAKQSEQGGEHGQPKSKLRKVTTPDADANADADADSDSGSGSDSDSDSDFDPGSRFRMSPGLPLPSPRPVRSTRRSPPSPKRSKAIGVW
jgi:hypothetical protein